MARRGRRQGRGGLLLPLLILAAACGAAAFVIPAQSRRPSIASSSLLLQSSASSSSASASSFSSSPTSAAAAAVPGVTIKEVTAPELRAAARVCIYAFFDTDPGKLVANPIKSLQLASLEDEQLKDLRSRFGGRQLGRSVMLGAVDMATGAMVGFVELRVRRDLKYGMGPGVQPKDERPYLANLAVLPSARRRGIARSLVKRGEALVQAWGFDELVLQVEDTNKGARRLYKQLGYADVYSDPAGRKYVLSGMTIKSERIKKIGMRKAPLRQGGSSSWGWEVKWPSLWPGPTKE